MAEVAKTDQATEVAEKRQVPPLGPCPPSSVSYVTTYANIISLGSGFARVRVADRVRVTKSNGRYG